MIAPGRKRQAWMMISCLTLVPPRILHGLTEFEVTAGKSFSEDSVRAKESIVVALP